MKDLKKQQILFNGMSKVRIKNVNEKREEDPMATQMTHHGDSFELVEDGMEFDSQQDNEEDDSMFQNQYNPDSQRPSVKDIAFREYETDNRLQELDDEIQNRGCCPCLKSNNH